MQKESGRARAAARRNERSSLNRNRELLPSENSRTSSVGLGTRISLAFRHGMDPAAYAGKKLIETD